MKTEQITVQATIEQALDKIWDYYTNPAHITQWNFASDDWCCPWAQNDLRAGGKYVSRMEAKDGSMGFDFEVVYDLVNPHKELQYTMGDGRKASVHFEEQDKAVIITIDFDPENVNAIELQRNGWQAILTNFKNYVEAN